MKRREHKPPTKVQSHTRSKDLAIPAVRDAVAYAERFHHFACNDLTSLGFMYGDPVITAENISGASVVYNSESGLHLSMDFLSPGLVKITFGRRWHWGNNYQGLSNYLFMFSWKFRLGLPESYQIGSDKKKVRATYETMLRDLRNALPRVLSQMSLADLVEIEQAELGRAWLAKRHFGGDYLKHVTLSEIILPPSYSAGFQAEKPDPVSVGTT